MDTTNTDIYGLLAEFSTPGALVEGTRKARVEGGYSKMEAHSPYPVEDLHEAIGFRKNPLPLMVLAAGILGGLSGFAMEYYSAVIDYPINVGGKPLNSWPAFIPVTFELTVLSAALTAVFGMILLNGLPMPYHPLFNVPEFARASSDRFFLFVRWDDPKFDLQETRPFLDQLTPDSISEVRR